MGVCEFGSVGELGVGDRRAEGKRLVARCVWGGYVVRRNLVGRGGETRRVGQRIDAVRPTGLPCW